MDWNQLSNLEKLSIKSFIDNGHEYHLYTYGPVKGQSAIIKDAIDIVRKEEIFTYKMVLIPHFQITGDFIYYLKKVDGGLIPTACVKSIKDEPYYNNDFVFVSEPDPKGNGIIMFLKLLLVW